MYKIQLRHHNNVTTFISEKIASNLEVSWLLLGSRRIMQALLLIRNLCRIWICLHEQDKIEKIDPENIDRKKTWFY